MSIPDTSSLPPEAVDLPGRMYDAARQGDIAVLQQALPAGLLPNLTNEKGDVLLMLAAYHGHAPLAKLLLEHGADPNRILLEGGADPDYGNHSAMECIVMFSQVDKWKENFEAASGRGTAAWAS
ncbi:ankyrin-like protein [Immersiella caudata]|uniref:Ankyrin-like protein n=1 Tax=Immersiella caudata TaxID=314043 RepID=A0AA39WA45_9PEZI|nr:ankyrin-like protein [Immersiella caudata]